MASTNRVRFDAGTPFRDAGDEDAVVKEFHEALTRAPDMAVAVAAIKVSGFDG